MSADSFGSDYASDIRHAKICLMTFDSLFGKRVLTYWENKGNPNYSQMNGFMVGIENDIFLERDSLIFPKMFSFPWVLLAHPFGCNRDFPYFPQISQYISTLFQIQNHFVAVIPKKGYAGGAVFALHSSLLTYHSFLL